MIMQFMVLPRTTTTIFVPRQASLLNVHLVRSTCARGFCGSPCISYWSIIARLLMPVFVCITSSLTTERLFMVTAVTDHMRGASSTMSADDSLQSVLRLRKEVCTAAIEKLDRT